MPMLKDYTPYTYDSARDGQLTTAGSPFFSPWFESAGISEVTIQAATVGGTTAYKVEESQNGSTAARTSGDLAASAVTDAGAKYNVVFPWFRLRIEQTVANTSSAQVAVKGSD